MNQTFISFPEGRLGESSRRLSLLAAGKSWFALEKPPGLPAVRDAFSRGKFSLMEALTEDVEAGKKQLRETGIAEAFPVTYPDEPVAGLFLCARTAEARQGLKNAMGASQFLFTYRFLTASAEEKDEIVCQLPLTHPEKSHRMLVSHTTGKKTETRFVRISRVGGYTLWEASSPYNRRHQVALHAFEIGLPILGEPLYSGLGPVYLSSLKRHYRAKGTERPLYEFPCVFQSGLRFPDPDTGVLVTIEVPVPRRLKALMNQARLHS